VSDQSDGGKLERWTATGDPGMTVWLVLIIASSVYREAAYVALGYGLAYVVVPGIVRLVRGVSPAASAGVASRPMLLVLASSALVAALLGVATHAGTTWWCAVAGMAALAGGVRLAARAR
jgi:hypothetical protein